MQKIDTNKLDVAIEYIKRMADGNNPVNNQPLPEESELNNVNIVRCLHFVTDVLQMVRDNNGVIGRVPKSKKAEFPFEVLKQFEYKDDTSISHLMERINVLVSDPNIKKIAASTVTKALKASGYLQEVMDGKLGRRTMPTKRGEEIGLYSEERVYTNGNEYKVVMYSEKAQFFLVNNLQRLLQNQEKANVREE